ncbi:MAG: hypothetical protein EA396_13945 [Anaerolineaceae bacterium]|nr:MAG: hypothetical protein EA396_13945 [Anaerolineaceae bacterium]
MGVYMVDQPTQPELPEGDKSEKDEENDGFSRWMMWFAGGLAASIFVVLIIGFLLSLTSPAEATVTRIGIIRDIFIILIALEFLLIILALTVLILQIARLIAMLRDEIKPIIGDTRDTVDTAKGTAKFVGQNVTRPVIGLSAFMAGVLAFTRELGGIRRAIRKEPRDDDGGQDDAA